MNVSLIAPTIDLTSQLSSIFSSSLYPSPPPAPSLLKVWDEGVEISWWVGSLTSSGSLLYEVEIAQGEFSDDFLLQGRVGVNIEALGRSYSLKYATGIIRGNISGDALIYTVSGLMPNSMYRLRQTEIEAGERRLTSLPLAFSTLPRATLFWDKVQARRLAIATIGRGLAYSVTQRPHLDSEAEIRTEGASKNPLRITDPPVSETPSFPAGRTGHSMTVAHDSIYVFGGRSAGNNQ